MTSSDRDELLERLDRAYQRGKVEGAIEARAALLKDAIDFETRHMHPTAITTSDGKVWECAEDAQVWRTNAIMLTKMLRTQEAWRRETAEKLTTEMFREIDADILNECPLGIREVDMGTLVRAVVRAVARRLVTR